MSDHDGDVPVLLHSLECFSREILACLDAVAPRRVIEIGSETGGFTVRLAEWAREHDAVVVSVDPDPPARLRRAAEGPNVEVVAAASPWALEGLEPGGAYVIDGDHNYWTVSAELRAAFAAEGPGPLVILHDVAWPWARRDLYYAPERLPEEAVREHTFRGAVRPGEPGVGDGGFRSLGHFAFAVEEGGERNGVLTAVEDFRAEREDLRFLRIPCVFGVGFLYSAEAPWAGAVEAAIGPLDESPLLRTLEANRVELYQRLLEVQEALERTRAANDRMLADLHAQVGQLQAENAALRLDLVRSP